MPGDTVTVDSLRARVQPSGPWFSVPAGTREADCAKCDADGLYWIVTEKGKKMLVDCAVPGGITPSGGLVIASGTELHEGRGVAHFATCPKANDFRRR